MMMMMTGEDDDGDYDNLHFAVGSIMFHIVKTPYHSLSKGFNDMNANTKCSSGATVLIQCLSQM